MINPPGEKASIEIEPFPNFRARLGTVKDLDGENVIIPRVKSLSHPVETEPDEPHLSIKDRQEIAQTLQLTGLPMLFCTIHDQLDQLTGTQPRQESIILSVIGSAGAGKSLVTAGLALGLAEQPDILEIPILDLDPWSIGANEYLTLLKEQSTHPNLKELCHLANSRQVQKLRSGGKDNTPPSLRQTLTEALPLIQKTSSPIVLADTPGRIWHPERRGFNLESNPNIYRLITIFGTETHLGISPPTQNDNIQILTRNQLLDPEATWSCSFPSLGQHPSENIRRETSNPVQIAAQVEQLLRIVQSVNTALPKILETGQAVRQRFIEHLLEE